MTSAKTITDAFMRSAEEIKSLRDQVAEQRAQITADNNEILTLRSEVASLKAGQETVRQQRDTLEQALEIATDDMDAVECPDCGGHGRREVYRDVTHQL
jgi:chromosome segregation ATPase